MSVKLLFLQDGPALLSPCGWRDYDLLKATQERSELGAFQLKVHFFYHDMALDLVPFITPVIMELNGVNTSVSCKVIGVMIK